MKLKGARDVCGEVRCVWCGKMEERSRENEDRGREREGEGERPLGGLKVRRVG